MERSVVLVFAVVVSSRNKSPMLKERTLRSFRYDNLLSPNCLGSTRVDRVVLSESSVAVGLAIRGADGVSLLAEHLVDLVAEALSTVRRRAGGGRAVGGAGPIAELVAYGVVVSDVLGASDAASSYIVGLAGNLRGVRNVRGGGSRAELEDWGLPVVALQC